MLTPSVSLNLAFVYLLFQIEFTEGETLTLLDNSNKSKWRVSTLLFVRRKGGALKVKSMIYLLR